MRDLCYLCTQMIPRLCYIFGDFISTGKGKLLFGSVNSSKDAEKSDGDVSSFPINLISIGYNFNYEESNEPISFAHCVRH